MRVLCGSNACREYAVTAESAQQHPVCPRCLAEGFEIESRAMEALAQHKPAETLSVHTSAGVPTQLDEFIAALKRHLPMADGDDWCVNLQSEGASAVHAAVDMGLQLFQGGQDFNRADARTRIACGASSYHGPASTSPGVGTPLGAVAKGLTHPVRYPVPSPFLRRPRGASRRRSAPSTSATRTGTRSRAC